MLNKVILAGALGLAIAGPAAAAIRDGFCNRATARAMRDPGELCACQRVTPDFLDYLRRSPAFPQIIGQLGESCPMLALLIADVPTGAIDEDDNDHGDSGGGGGGGGDGGGGDGGGGDGGGGDGGGGDGGGGGGTGGGGHDVPDSPD